MSESRPPDHIFIQRQMETVCAVAGCEHPPHDDTANECVICGTIAVGAFPLCGEHATRPSDAASLAAALLTELAFMRSCIASGERLDADDIARQDALKAQYAALPAPVAAVDDEPWFGERLGMPDPRAALRADTPPPLGGLHARLEELADDMDTEAPTFAKRLRTIWREEYDARLAADTEAVSPTYIAWCEACGYAHSGEYMDCIARLAADTEAGSPAGRDR